MLNIKKFTIASLTLISFSASAEVSMNLGVTSNYMWRGVTQSDDGVAISGGIDYANDNGFYAGVWTGNVDFGASSGSEVDLYVGYASSINSIDYDIGYVMYTYPNSGFEDSNYSEISLKTSYESLTLGVALTVISDIDDDQAFSTGDIYTHASYSFELPQEYSLTLTGGIYTFDENESLFGNNDDSHIQVDINKSDFTFSVSKATEESGSDDLNVFASWKKSF